MSYSLNAKANQPSRSSGTIMLSWGMMTIPLSVYSGSEEVRVSRKEFVEGDPSRSVGRASIDKSKLPNIELVEAGDVTRMVQASSGAWVVMTDDEMAACTMPKGVAEIISFVPRDEMWAYLPEDIGQVRPQKVSGKANPAVVKAFSLLLTAMAGKDVAALVKFALRGPARYGLLCPNGDLIYVKTADQVREPLPLDLVPVDAAHLSAADALIDAIGSSAPVIVNETAEAIMTYVETKAAGQPVPEVKVANNMSDDLMASLMASVDAAQAARK